MGNRQLYSKQLIITVLCCLLYNCASPLKQKEPVVYEGVNAFLNSIGRYDVIIDTPSLVSFSNYFYYPDSSDPGESYLNEYKICFNGETTPMAIYTIDVSEEVSDTHYPNSVDFAYKWRKYISAKDKEANRILVRYKSSLESNCCIVINGSTIFLDTLQSYNATTNLPSFTCPFVYRIRFKDIKDEFVIVSAGNAMASGSFVNDTWYYVFEKKQNTYLYKGMEFCSAGTVSPPLVNDFNNDQQLDIAAFDGDYERMSIDFFAINKVKSLTKIPSVYLSVDSNGKLKVEDSVKR